MPLRLPYSFAETGSLRQLVERLHWVHWDCLLTTLSASFLLTIRHIKHQPLSISEEYSAMICSSISP
jgi:hypothetical protein